MLGLPYTICINGEQAIDTCIGMINDKLNEPELKNEGSEVKPVSLCLLDFQMPLKNGIQVIEEIRSYIVLRQTKFPEILIQEPTFVILTAFRTPAFSSHLQSLGVTECYEKPL
jgi:DNA-binding NarL/FixJ family response regulator